MAYNKYRNRVNPLTPTAWVWYDPYYTWKSPIRDLRGERVK
jgi:hypothetical protein